MTFSRWLYMNNYEKIKILLYILPVVIGIRVIKFGISDYLLIGVLVTILLALPIFAYKNLLFVNKVANKYNSKLVISFKQALVQSVSACLINGLLLLVLLAMVGAIWLLTLATGSVLLKLIAIVLSLIAIAGYMALGKLAYYTILNNVESNQLQFKDYIENFTTIYEQNFKMIVVTIFKAMAYSFVTVMLLTLILITAYDYSIGWLINLTAITISFVMYWIDITIIQYLSREYTK